MEFTENTMFEIKTSKSKLMVDTIWHELVKMGTDKNGDDYYETVKLTPNEIKILYLARINSKVNINIASALLEVSRQAVIQHKLILDAKFEKVFGYPLFKRSKDSQKGHYEFI